MIIHGKDSLLDDIKAFRDALNTPVSEPIEIELTGRFNFGGGWDGRNEPGLLPRETVVINRSVRIKTHDSTNMAEIIGGGAMLPCGDTFGKVDSGPFQVQGGDVSFERIHFSGWKGEAISVVACDGLSVQDCKFTKPAPGTATALAFVGPDNRPFRSVHAVFAFGPGCKGSFVASGNKCDLMEYATDPLYVIYPRKETNPHEEPVPHPPTKHTEALADDEQFFACIGTNFSVIHVTGNQIMGHDEGLEVIANQNNQQLEIVGNRITLNQIVGERWGAHFGHVGIFCSVNRDAVIKDNTIDLTGPGIGLVLSGENFRVEERNEVFLKPLDQDPNTYPLAGIVLGMNSTRSPIPAAPSLNDSIISGNIIHGKAYYAILTYDALNDAIPYPSSPPPPNQSHNNKIIFNSFPDFQPLYTSLLLRSGTHDNYCEGYFPSPGPDRPGYINEGTNNTVTLPTLPHPEPLPHAEVLRRAG